MRDPTAFGLPLRTKPDLESGAVALRLAVNVGAVVLGHPHFRTFEAGYLVVAVLHVVASIFTPVFGIVGRLIIKALTICPSWLFGSSQALFARSASLLAC